MDYYQASVDLHRKLKGKIELRSKVPLDSRESLSLAYTPGVAQVSREIGKDPSLARELTLKANTIAVVSDGSAILGLGNLGALAAIPVMEGKAALFKEFAGVDAFPICLDTQDTEEIIKAVKLIAPVFGGINLEDISAPRCFEIEDRLKKELDIPVMHDDQHGTAVVVLAAAINSLKLAGKVAADVRVAVSGAGAAGTATVKLFLKYGFRNMVVADSKGIIGKSRTDLNEEKIELAEITNPDDVSGSLADAVRGADIFIGVSKAGLLTPDMVRSMAQKPIVFAMANPEPEIMPDEAKEAGVFIIGTGRSDFPNQVNNVLVFPGVFRGALDNRVTQITPDMLIRAAEAIASYVKDPSPDSILPSALDKDVAKAVANSIR